MSCTDQAQYRQEGFQVITVIIDCTKLNQASAGNSAWQKCMSGLQLFGLSWHLHQTTGLRQQQAVTGLAREACMRQQSSSLGMVCQQAWHHILLHGLRWGLKHQVHHDGLYVLPNRGDIFALQPHTTLRHLISSSELAQISGSFSASNYVARAGTALSAAD